MQEKTVFNGLDINVKGTMPFTCKPKVERPKIKKCPLCGVRHYEPTHVCKLCKEKH